MINMLGFWWVGIGPSPVKVHFRYLPKDSFYYIVNFSTQCHENITINTNPGYPISSRIVRNYLQLLRNITG